MSLYVTGNARVYQFSNKGSYATASLQVGKKKPDSEWENMWFNTKFVGKNTPDNIEKGTKVELVKAILESNKGKDGKTYTNIIIFECKDEGGYPPQETVDSMISDEDLPF
jgi:hypothetical protein